MISSSTISTILTTILLLVHSALVAVDFLGVYPVADFLIRSADGSQMDPKNMLPLEELFVAMLAFPFLTVILGFVVCKNRRDAALISVATHGIYAFHQVWKKKIWDAILHPDTDISTEFFLYSHIGWAIVSGVIYALSKGDTNTATPTSSGNGETKGS